MPTALLFAGQGAQSPRMAVDRYERDSVFARTADEFLELMGGDLRDRWLHGDRIDHGRYSQPLLFMVGYATAKSLLAQGFRPDVLLGHSVGELAAAAVAEVFDLPAAARLMAARTEAISDVPPGGMLAVAATPGQLPYLPGVVAGAYNAPRQTVLSGDEKALRAAERALRRAQIVCVRVAAHEPWHSPAMAQAAGRFTRALAAESLRPPRIPIQSTGTGLPVSDGEAVTPQFWGWQMVEPVRYWSALSALVAQDDYELVEAGPCAGLTAQVRRKPGVRVVVPA